MARTREIGELIEEEYLEHLDTDDDEMWWLKEALRYGLNTLERKIFIQFLECGSYAGTARVFRVSTPTLKAYIQDLKVKIIEWIDEQHKNGTNNT